MDQDFCHSFTHGCCSDSIDVTLANEDITSIPTDEAKIAMQVLPCDMVGQTFSKISQTLWNPLVCRFPYNTPLTKRYSFHFQQICRPCDVGNFSRAFVIMLLGSRSIHCVTREGQGRANIEHKKRKLKTKVFPNWIRDICHFFDTSTIFSSKISCSTNIWHQKSCQIGVSYVYQRTLKTH